MSDTEERILKEALSMYNKYHADSTIQDQPLWVRLGNSYFEDKISFIPTEVMHSVYKYLGLVPPPIEYSIEGVIEQLSLRKLGI